MNVSFNKAMENMNKSLLIIPLFSIVFFCTSVFEETSFKIKGQIDGDYKEYIYLHFDNHKDSTLVVKGKFEFKGTVNRVSQASFSTIGISSIDRIFFLEPGVININIKISQKHIRGYDLNMIEILSVEGTKTSIIVDRLKKFENQYKHQKNWPKLFVAVISRLIEKHADNPFSGNLLHRFSNDTLLSKSQLRTLFEKLNLQFQDPWTVSTLKKRLLHKEKIKVGNLIPEFTLKNIEGLSRSSKKLNANNYTLFEFWASWCKPCLEKVPQLKALAIEEKYNQFKIVGISFDEDRSGWRRKVIDTQLPWNNLIDTTGTVGDLATKFSIESIPFSVLTDASGKIIGINLSIEELKIKLDSIFSQPY